MVVMTQSMEEWLWRFHRDILALVSFGHLELITDELAQEYIEWCQTDEGRQYLKGGSKYDPNHKGNIASAKAHANGE